MPWTTMSVPAMATTMTLLVASALAGEATRVNVELEPGTNGRKLEGRIEGDQSVDYIVEAEAGQRWTVTFESDNMGSYINVYPPGSDAPIHVGANLGNRFQGALSESGAYRVHAFLMPNAAHRGEIANFSIEFRRDPDADGQAGGPDFWSVTGVPKGEAMDVHSRPSTSADALGSVTNGTRVKNLGCRVEDDARWCRVRTLGDPSVEGWLSGRYLSEGAAPAAGGRTTQKRRDGPEVPELVLRSSGEIEVNFETGCGVLFDADGKAITAGSSCSPEQLRKASEAVKAHRR